MPRKTLALIVGLVLVTIILFIIAIKTGQNQKPPVEQEQAMTQPTSVPDVAHTVLSMNPNPVAVASGRQGMVEVSIDPADNLITGVQLELAYDPTMITNVKVAYGPKFTNPLVLFNKSNAKGTFTYGFGIQPGQKPVSGQGVAAIITFTATGAVGKESQITLLPTTLVTARGTSTTVLKMASGTTVKIATQAEAAASSYSGANSQSPVTPTQ